MAIGCRNGKPREINPKKLSVCHPFCGGNYRIMRVKWVKRLLCRIFGHKWEIYPYQTGYYSYDIEMAGCCKRCGVDTHGTHNYEVGCVK